MSASVENESEILLGNKQLLAVFAVVAILLATAFTGGYMLGKSSAQKSSGADSPQTPAENPGGPITKRLTPDETQPARVDPSPVQQPRVEPPAEQSRAEPPKTTPVRPKPETKSTLTVDTDENVLGRPPRAPRPGEAFVQVTAVARKEAEVSVDVLRQHGFQALIAPAPGVPGTFRVLIGPEKDSAESRNTQDKLRKIGYTKCFVQHY